MCGVHQGGCSRLARGITDISRYRWQSRWRTKWVSGHADSADVDTWSSPDFLVQWHSLADGRIVIAVLAGKIILGRDPLLGRVGC